MYLFKMILNMVLIIAFPATKPCQAHRGSCLKPSTFTAPSSWNTLPLHDSLLLLPWAVCKHHLPSEVNPPLNTHYYTATFLWPALPIPLPCFTFPGELLTFHSLVHLSPVHTIIIHLSSLECRLHDGRNFFHWCLHRTEKKVAEKIPVAHYFLDERIRNFKYHMEFFYACTTLL